MSTRALQPVVQGSRRHREASRSSQRVARRLQFERLEDRRVLAIFAVSTLSDAAVSGPDRAPGTLRQAIYDANALSDVDVIEFAPELAGNVNISIVDDTLWGTTALVVSSPITIRGNLNGITIARDSAAAEMRLFRVTATGTLAFETISVAGGIARGVTGTSSGEDGGTGQGGAVLNQGTLHVISSTMHSNQAIGGDAGSGGQAGLGAGGAIFNDGGIVSVENSTLSGNSVFSGTNGSIFNRFGGAIYTRNGTVTIYNSTLTSNSAITGRGLYVLAKDGTATVDIQSSIIGQSDALYSIREFQTAPDDNGQIVVTGGNNLIRTQGDYTFITVSTDDPMLGPLLNNGGPTPTHALVAGSPAIDLGANLQGLSVDQRGGTYSRVVGTAADIGAYESQAVVAPRVPGDYNRNDVVDAADFIIWRKTFGTVVQKFSGADGNGNGEVGDGDYDVWRAHFGEMAPMGAALMPSPGADAASADNVSSAPVAESGFTEALGSFELFFTSASPRAAHFRFIAAAGSVGVASRGPILDLLVLPSAELLQRSDEDGSAEMTALAGVSTTNVDASAEAVEESVFGTWPTFFMPIL